MQRHERQARMRFGEWLDVTLENRGIASRKLAEAAGVNDSTVSRWRAGAALPSLSNVVDIAAMLGLDWQRVAVTASVLPQDAAPGVEPYPTPEPTAKRESAKRMIEKIKGLSPEGRALLLETYDQVVSQEREA